MNMNDKLSALFVCCSTSCSRHARISAHHTWEPLVHIDYRGCENLRGVISLFSITEYYYIKHSRLIIIFFSTFLSTTFVSSLDSVHWKGPLDVRTVRPDRNIANVPVRSSGFYSARALDRSPISNAVYECRPVTSRVLDKNRLLGLREIGGNFNARTNRPHATSSHVWCTTARTVFRTLIDGYRRGSVFPFVQCYRSTFFCLSRDSTRTGAQFRLICN